MEKSLRTWASCDWEKYSFWRMIGLADAETTQKPDLNEQALWD
jgi:hypothetical protein